MLRRGRGSSKRSEDEAAASRKAVKMMSKRRSRQSDADEFKSSTALEVDLVLESLDHLGGARSTRSSPTHMRSRGRPAGAGAGAGAGMGDAFTMTKEDAAREGRSTRDGRDFSARESPRSRDKREDMSGGEGGHTDEADEFSTPAAGGTEGFSERRSTGRRSNADSFVELFCETRIVTLNVGGVRFATSRETLSRDQYCMLTVLISGHMSSTKDETGAYFIDRDPTHFRYILNFLRDGAVDLPDDATALAQLLREAYFYQVEDLIRAIETKRRKGRRKVINRESVLLMLHSAPRLQLPATYMAGLNLSHLRLRTSVFLSSDLTGANLAHCDCEKTVFTNACMKGANLSNAVLTEAKLNGANLTDANLRKAQLYKSDLKGACLRNADLTRANLQDANLKGVVLEGANLSKSILIGADLRGFNLEGANLQGANLEGARLQGVNLRHANLQGANLWNAFLQDADLSAAVLKDANLQRADLSGITGTFVR